MLARVETGAVDGVDAFTVRVEVNIESGLPAFTVVGQAHRSVREGRERVGAALRNSGFGLPNRRITVNLAPADIGKVGTGFDLAIAIGVLAAAGSVPSGALRGRAFLGELGLDGVLRPVSGVLPIAAHLRSRGIETLVVPADNVEEAALIAGLRVLGAPNLRRAAEDLTGAVPLDPFRGDPAALLAGSGPRSPDLADVQGQATAKRALEIAAAGGHNLLLVGPPGAGKTMLARRLPGILPPLTLDEALETTRVHSVAGRVRGGGLLAERPFRAPHHSVSYAGLVGGGRPVRPGEISLAHEGVLFLDELAEYPRNVLEVLRQPLEDGYVRIARAHRSVRLPARFLLVGAMNPCPCGHWGDGTDRCLCDPGRVARYRGRVSGPLLDRIDLHVPVAPVPVAALRNGPEGATSSEVRARVSEARGRQRARVGARPGPSANGHLPPAELREHCRPSASVARLLQDAVDRLGLSARGYHRTLRVARTIADLAGAERIGAAHVAEAVQYRSRLASEDRAA